MSEKNLLKLNIGMTLSLTIKGKTSLFKIEEELLQNDGVLGRTYVNNSFIVSGKRNGKYILAYAPLEKKYAIHFSSPRSKRSGTILIDSLEVIKHIKGDNPL